MGKLKLRGHTKRKFTADLMEVTISISTDGETAAYAINKGKRETEKVLKLLVELGIDLSKVKMINEYVSEPSRYDDEEWYSFEKSISFISQANLTLLERLSSGIVEREIDAIYRERFCVSNAENVEKQVLQEALLDSRKKAEAMAETLGQRITGIESAKCDGYEGDNEEEDDGIRFFSKGFVVDKYPDSLAEQLAPGTIVIEKSIDVSWIVE